MGSKDESKQKPGAPIPADKAENVARFRGNFFHTIDDKGRVSLPVDFRRSLNRSSQPIRENSVVLTNYISEGSRCLEGFSLKIGKPSNANCARRADLAPSYNASKISILAARPNVLSTAAAEFCSPHT